MSVANSSAIRFIIVSEILEFLALAILIPIIPPLVVGDNSVLFAEGTTEAYKKKRIRDRQ